MAVSIRFRFLKFLIRNSRIFAVSIRFRFNEINNKQRISLIWNSREGTQGLPWYGSLLGVQKVMHHDEFIWRLKTSKNLVRVELVFSVLRSRSSNRQAIITWTLCLTYCFTRAKFPVVQNLTQLFNTWLNLAWTYMFYNHFWYIHCYTGIWQL